MNSEITDLTDWLKTPPGEYLLAWEREQLDQAVSDIFGYHALQLGLPELDALRTNRMPHRWLAGHAPARGKASDVVPTRAAANADASLTALPAQVPRPRAALLVDAAALPFAQSSLDLVVLPHTLELSRDPHASLREVERVLVPEGRVVITGLNPTSLWHLRQRRADFFARLGYQDRFLPQAGEFINYWRLRDWLRLLSFEVESGRFGCYKPALTSRKWLQRFDWMDRAGARWWPIFGAVYFVVAVKRVRGARLLEPSWKFRKSVAAAPAVVASKEPLVRPPYPQPR